MTDAVANLEVKNVSFSFEEHPILHDVNLRVVTGEFISILGPNGAGKTTLLRLMMNLLEPSQGVVLLNGEQVRNIPRPLLAKRMALVPQMESVVFPYTVREMVMFGRYPHLTGFGFEKKEDFEIVDMALERTSISDLAARRITELSGGEYHRVIIARALAQQTPLLLLDEPNAHLDLKHQTELFSLLHELNRTNGTTIVCITHDLNLAALYSHRIAILAQSTIAAEGTPAEIITAEIIAKYFQVDATILNDPETSTHAVILKRTIL
jgi:iron complex transport system ATP-binding protein